MTTNLRVPDLLGGDEHTIARSACCVPILPMPLIRPSATFSPRGEKGDEKKMRFRLGREEPLDSSRCNGARGRLQNGRSLIHTVLIRLP